MAWRVFNSLLVLRDQVNVLAPGRSKGADGTVCDENHPTTSDHCPHYVQGVSPPDMVSALDLTHDPAGGFNSYTFAEVLRVHRDRRIKYVISDHRMFSSYATSSYPAWTWRPYSGEDPHTNHVHISVLDAAISDDKTQWNLEGFNVSTADEVWQWNTGSSPNPVQAYKRLNQITEVRTVVNNTDDKVDQLDSAVDGLTAQLDQMDKKLDAILAKLSQMTPAPGTPVAYNFTGTATPQV